VVLEWELIQQIPLSPPRHIPANEHLQRGREKLDLGDI